MGIPLDEMALWNPHDPALGGNPRGQIENSRVILWQGHCSVHAMFKPEHVDAMRAGVPGVKILVHPECSMEVVDKADLTGSTSYILRQVEQAAPGTRWAIGTELHLVKRLEKNHPEQTIRFLSPVICMCATMYRIDLAHLCWSLEHLEARQARQRDPRGRRDGAVGRDGARADARGEVSGLPGARGCPHPESRTFAAAILAFAHSMPLSLRHPGFARPATPALGAWPAPR